jgi:glycyl-tRNA synthetase beta chain
VNGELLLEVRTEEIPARMLPGAAKELATRLFEELMARGVPPSEVGAGFTPRRLWLTMAGLPAKEEDRDVVEIGPPAAAAFDADGNPTAAALGFAKKFGVEAGALERVDLSKDKDFLLKGVAVSGAVPKGERVVLRRKVAGAATREILSAAIPALLKGISWAKTMRWGSGVGPWVRPVHGVVALLDGEIVPFELFGIAAGRTTAGHPTLSPAPFEVAGVAAWRERLESLGIVPEPAERERRLRAEMESRAAAAGGTLVDDSELLAKLAAICEIPGVLEGALEPALLALPREVLVTSLRDHQSALTVERDGRLLPHFLTVMDRPDDPAGRVRAGNEWVVAARLADARFFWEKDRATPLQSRIADLDGLGFHQKLGSYGEKRRRLIALCRFVAEKLLLPAEQLDALVEAASLAKADLTTDMVREFTSLQGVMGGIYAREEGKADTVWSALYDQYRPSGPGDELPRNLVAQLLAYCDRLDTLTGFFRLGEKFWPSGSKDPFGLRRAALGLVRICIEGEPVLDVAATLREADRLYGDLGAGRRSDAHGHESIVQPQHALPGESGPLVDFLWDRAEFAFESRGLAHDEIAAARRAEGCKSRLDFRGAMFRAMAIQRSRGGRSFLAVVLAAKRIANITKDQPSQELVVEALELPAERALHEAAGKLFEVLARSLDRQDYAAGVEAVGELAPSLESFFDEVLVLDPDPAKRANRLALLQRIGGEIARLADLSRLVVDKADYR